MKKSILLLLIAFSLQTSMKAQDYDYPAFINEVYDADTVTATIYLGFGNYTVQKIRLYGINAPEMRGEEKEKGTISRDSLRNRILGKNVRIKTLQDKQGKYGRYLGIIYSDTLNLNKWLVREKLAIEQDY